MLKIKSPEKKDEDTVPLKSVSVTATINSFAAQVNLTQVFKNEEDKPIEAVYCFPIEENAAIHSFIARIDEREIVTQVKKRKEAQQEYSEALNQGHGAFLLENDEKSNDIFIVNVGALLPQKECTIEIAYVTELYLTKGKYINLTIPTTIAPRYNPDVGAVSSPAGTNSKYVQKAPYAIKFECIILKNEQIVNFSSPSHPMKIDVSNPMFTKMSFSQDKVSLDRDIIVNLELSKQSNTILSVEKNKSGDLCLMAAFIPNEDDCVKINGNVDDIRNEFIFIVDCSGSMEDESKIDLARQAMLLFLKSLPTNCYFNIIRFGSNYKVLFESETVAVYDEGNALKAEKMISDMKADLGGTELLAPLTWLFSRPPKAGYSRQIFLLTDGEISNVTEVTNECAKASKTTRVFSFGLGHSPSRSLIKGLARSTNGRFVFIPPNSSVDEYVAEQLEKALEPSLVGLSVKWNFPATIEKEKFQNIPATIPPVYSNDRTIVYALLDKQQESALLNGNFSVELLSKDNISVGRADVDTSRVSSSDIVTFLAAKAKIQELLTNSQGTSPHGSRQSRFQDIQKDEDSESKELVTQMSLKYGILCPYTAFVGVEKRKEGNNAEMILKEIPVQISADDDHGFGFGGYLGAAPKMMSCMAMQSCCFAQNQVLLYDLDVNADMSLGSDVTDGSMSGFHVNFLMSGLMPEHTITPLEDVKKEVWPTQDQDIVRHLIKLQKFDGLWNLDENEIQLLCNKPLSQFRTNEIVKNGAENVLTSLVVLIALETKFSPFETLWKAVFKKAKKRIIDLLPSANVYESLSQEISKVFLA